MTLLHHVTFEDSSVLVWISHDISSFSPEIPEDASTRQFLEHHRSLRPRADGVQDLFEGLQQAGLGWERLLESHGFHHKRWRMVVEGTESWHVTHVTVNSIDRILLSEISVPNRRGTMD